MNSTIIRKPCKCGCGRMPSLGYGGYNEMCNPKKRQEKIDKIAATQRAAFGQQDEDDLSAIEDDLDMVVSRYVRIREADENGISECFVCGDKMRWQEMHCSHYIHRTDKATRWLIDNLTCSCPKCNENHNDNPKPYTEAMERFRPGITEYLLEQSRQVAKPSRWELKELLASYKAKLKIVEQKLKK